MADERRQGNQGPIGLRVRLPFANLDAFVAGYAVNVSREGIFLERVAPRPVDTLVRFELVLADGQVAMRGEGRVVGVRSADGRAGLSLRFTRLDSRSKALVDRMVGSMSRGAETERAERAATSLSPSRPSLAELERELDAMWNALPSRATSSVRSGLGLRSLEEIEQELERLSAEILASFPRCRVALGSVVPVSPSPVPVDSMELPPVLSLRGDHDGEDSAAITVPPISPSSHSVRDRTDAAGALNLVMREPTPIPDPPEHKPDAEPEFIPIPRAPAVPRADVTATLSAVADLPDLDLGEMLEPEPYDASELNAQQITDGEEPSGEVAPTTLPDDCGEDAAVPR